MAKILVPKCEVCGNYGRDVEVLDYKIMFPGPNGSSPKYSLCTEHAKPLLKVREDVEAARTTEAAKAAAAVTATKRKGRGQPIVPVD